MLEIKVGDTIQVNKLRVQYSVGWEVYSGQIQITAMVPKGSESRLKVNMKNAPPPTISTEDYFHFKLLSYIKGTIGTSSRSQLESAYLSTKQFKT